MKIFDFLSFIHQIIDADQDEEKVFESVSLFVDSVLDAVKDYPIRKLWI